MLGFFVDNIYVVFGDQVFQQFVGIPMGTNCAPLLVDLFSHSNEAEFVQKLLWDNNKKTNRVLQPYIQIYRWCPINQQTWFSQLCPLDISRWTRNKGHHRIWQICFISRYFFLNTDSNGRLLQTWWFLLCNHLIFFYVTRFSIGWNIGWILYPSIYDTILNFINSSQNVGLSPSCIALSFDRFGSISWHSIWVFFRLFYSFHNFSDFLHFRSEYHWRDLISRNAHLVHQNWYRISFIF
jgi:hypothetical protein